jgi:hypothetical protein
VWRVRGATNVDWEAVSVGPCGAAEPAGAQPNDCVFIGDTGDNVGKHASRVIYRVREPRAQRAGFTGDIEAEALHYRYPDGAHDVEAMLVTPAGDLLLLAKSFKAPPGYYRVPARAWATPGTVATAEALGTLPIDPGALGRWITDAALAPDGRHVAVRTYRDLFAFRLEADGRLAQGDPPTQCDVTGLGPQGEGVAWLDARTLVLTSEHALGLPAAIHVVRCPTLRADAAGADAPR